MAGLRLVDRAFISLTLIAWFIRVNVQSRHDMFSIPRCQLGWSRVLDLIIMYVLISSSFLHCKIKLFWTWYGYDCSVAFGSMRILCKPDVTFWPNNQFDRAELLFLFINRSNLTTFWRWACICLGFSWGTSWHAFRGRHGCPTKSHIMCSLCSLFRFRSQWPAQGLLARKIMYSLLVCEFQTFQAL